MPLDPKKMCDCGCGETFGQKRRHQRFVNHRHRERFHNRRLYRRKLKAPAGGETMAYNTHLSARRPRTPARPLLWEKRGEFSLTHSPGARPVLKVREDGRVSWLRFLPRRRRGAEGMA
jgi:hypothetical protein